MHSSASNSLPPFPLPVNQCGCRRMLDTNDLPLPDNNGAHERSQQLSVQSSSIQGLRKPATETLANVLQSLCLDVGPGQSVD